MSKSQGGAWKEGDLVATYLGGVRAAIPLAAEQIETMVRVVVELTGGIHRYADLGCGDGILSAALLDRFPQSSGVLVDHSPPMLERARERFGSVPNELRFIEADLSRATWCGGLEGSFDAVVSGFSIHHLTHHRKQKLYREIFGLLAPGGIFINVEHVSSPTPEIEHIFNESMVDAIFAQQQRDDSRKTRAEVAREFVYRPDKAENILAPVEDQCRWLRRIGYEQVDCFLRYFELAVFGGRKPSSEA
ncbi:MAG: class I SAM-dependent methyltransferase [Gemmatimonadetes bacterium]|nr:class I SAM-dependent methyltransferase [Gemmatimonadota bacterium]